MSNKFVKNSLVVLFLTLLAKLFGFIRELSLSYFFGATNITDAYLTAYSIYSVLVTALPMALTISYVQVVSKETDTSLQNEITTLTIKYSALVMIITSAICIIFSDTVILMVASGFDTQTVNITKMLMYMQMPFAVFTVIQYLFGAFLQAKRVFWMGGSCLIIANIAIILSIILSNGENYFVLGMGLAGSVIACFIFAIIFAIKYGFRFKRKKYITSDKVLPILTLAIPIFLGQLVQQLNVIVDKNFASTVGEGIISSINYANRVNILFSTLFVASITTVLFPALSKLSDDNRDKFNEISVRSTKVISLLAFPVAVGISMLAPQIIEVLFMRGAFTAENAMVTSEVLMIYAVAIPAISLTDVLNKQFYAMADTKTPVILSIATLVINIILNFIWVRTLGHIGLALSTTIALVLLCILLNIVFAKKYGLSIIKENRAGLAKIILASGIMGVVVFGLKLFTVGMSSLLIIIICAAVGAGVYFLVMFLLGDRELRYILNRMLRREIGEAQ